ncbi:hypothetical protein BMS3Bbin15_00174 [archaeon BMS3Bbin15]|nr:hypothetical protein BMS3Bbin15_00174 [archaeon BMS3Bbin15]
MNNDIIIPVSDDIITINEKLGGSVINPGVIGFVIARINAKQEAGRHNCRYTVV